MSSLGTYPSDDDLLKWKNPSEDHFIERKTSGDSRDWLKTLVAFANSVPVGRYAVMYVGVRDDGTVEGGTNLDSIQKTLRQKMTAAYPPIEYVSRVLAEDRAEFLCVLVSASRKRPHFSGPAYVRVGSETIDGSREQHERMLTQWNDKAARLLEAHGHDISVTVVHMDERNRQYNRFQSGVMQITDCTPHTLTLRSQYGHTEHCPLDNVTLTEGSPHMRGHLSLRVRVD